MICNGDRRFTKRTGKTVSRFDRNLKHYLFAKWDNPNYERVYLEFCIARTETFEVAI
jgi:hypothetical protein